MTKIEPVSLASSLKNPESALGKIRSAEETVRWAVARMNKCGGNILKETRRIDTGRLGIPVYMSICAPRARALLPTRKQMGKGPDPAQAEASAIMELLERHAFFGFWQRTQGLPRLRWSEAQRSFGDDLISVREILRSVDDDLDEQAAEKVLDIHPWLFYPATRLSDGKNVQIPADWFRMLGEFNGSSAGNSPAESIMQGLCELVERHVSCLADLKRPTLAEISLNDCDNPVLAGLVERFRLAGVKLVLKDMSMGMPVPTVAALAWDPATFPERSEIVLTAGTASSPVAAAIRAITEVAQLGGDFHTSSCYEASGLPKFNTLAECAWLMEGPRTSLSSLPDIQNDDILNELRKLLRGLHPLEVYSIATTDPDLQIPAHWTIAPGLQFRERDRAQSLGLFTGRKLAEESPFDIAMQGLKSLAEYYPNAHFLPFFHGMVFLRNGMTDEAFRQFAEAIEQQPHTDARAMASFYAGYSLGCRQEWARALPYLREAFNLCPQMAEYGNQAGVACYRLGEYAEAENFFDQVLRQNRGSATDLANRGICRKFLGRDAEARADLEAALELDPTMDFARKHLAGMAN